MEVSYKNEKLRKLCEDPNCNEELKKKYGIEVAKKLPQRIIELKAFETLNDVPVSLPFRRHKLKGNLQNNYAVDINRQYRLIFVPNTNNIVIENLKEIKNIKILEVSKHYE